MTIRVLRYITLIDLNTWPAFEQVLTFFFDINLLIFHINFPSQRDQKLT